MLLITDMLVLAITRNGSREMMYRNVLSVSGLSVKCPVHKNLCVFIGKVNLISANKSLPDCLNSQISISASKKHVGSGKV